MGTSRNLTGIHVVDWFVLISLSLSLSHYNRIIKNLGVRRETDSEGLNLFPSLTSNPRTRSLSPPSPSPLVLAAPFFHT